MEVVDMDCIRKIGDDHMNTYGGVSDGQVVFRITGCESSRVHRFGLNFCPCLNLFLYLIINLL